MMSSMRNKAKNNMLLLVWAACLTASLIVIKLSYGMLISDDAYITISHSKTWLEIGRPLMSAYNPVCATSTPLYMIIITAFAYLFSVEPTYVAFALNFTLSFINVILVYKIGKVIGLEQLFSASAATIYGLSNLALSTSASGMETPMYIALILSGFWLVLGSSSNVRISGIIFLLALTRPEGVVASFSIAVLAWFRTKTLKPIIGFISSAALGLLALLFFYFVAYNNIFPHSVIAKNAGVFTKYLGAIGFWFNTLFYGVPEYGGMRSRIFGNVLFTLLGIIGLILAPWNQKRVAIKLSLWPILYFSFFIFTKSSHEYFTWYYLPVLPFLIIILSSGLQDVFNRLKFNRYKSISFVLLSLFCALVCFRNISIDKISFKNRKAHHEREGLYQQAAEFVKKNSDPESTIMIGEVGTVGYFSNRKIIDEWGIISPEVIKNGFGNPGKLIDLYGPHWIICAAILPEKPPAYVSTASYQLQLSLPNFNHEKNLQVWKKHTSTPSAEKHN